MPDPDAMGGVFDIELNEVNNFKKHVHEDEDEEMEEDTTYSDVFDVSCYSLI